VPLFPIYNHHLKQITVITKNLPAKSAIQGFASIRLIFLGQEPAVAAFPVVSILRGTLVWMFDAVVTELDSAELAVFHAQGHFCLPFALVTLFHSDVGDNFEIIPVRQWLRLWRGFSNELDVRH
jgi:hypothetical protein